jgi:hypothetical protein
VKIERPLSGVSGRTMRDDATAQLAPGTDGENTIAKPFMQ